MASTLMIARRAPTVARTFRLSDVVSALTYALDLTEGQPEGHTLRACCIGMRAARELGLDDAAADALFYTLLLKDAGCSSNAATLVAMFGADDQAVKRDARTADWTSLRGAAGYVWRNIDPDIGRRARIGRFTRIVHARDAGGRDLVRIRCERGAGIVARLGFGAATTDAIRSLDEHWDGSGHPDGLRGATIPLNARIALLAQTIEVFLDGGAAGALDVVRSRRATWFDPALVDLVCGWRDDDGWWDALRGGDVAGIVAALEPRDTIRSIDEAGLDRIAEAFAEVIDAKSPYTFNHSYGVAFWARSIGETLEMGDIELRALYRAGLLHDIGKLGISNRILDKPARLTSDEFARVRRHPAWTWDILRHVAAFTDFARPAALHHERLDGSGYPWGIDASGLDLSARILCVADVFEALMANRPYRPGLPQEAVLAAIARETPRLYDPRVVDALEACVRATG